MDRSLWLRHFHRWVSIAFTAGVIINMVALTKGQPPLWVGLLAGVPLILLMLSGLYLFVLPYAVRWRSGVGRGVGG